MIGNEWLLKLLGLFLSRALRRSVGFRLRTSWRFCVVAGRWRFPSIRQDWRTRMADRRDEFVNLLGQAAMEVWGDMPRDVQEALFETAMKGKEK